MKLVVQRVKKAGVSVKGELVGQIGLGLFVLIGFGIHDTPQKVDDLAKKLVKLRVMADESEKMNLSIKESTGSVLAVSQFTLYADTSGGNRPSFIKAMHPQEARKLYDLFVEKLREEGLKVETGKFGEYMCIDCQLDGPVTIILEN